MERKPILIYAVDEEQYKNGNADAKYVTPNFHFVDTLFSGSVAPGEVATLTSINPYHTLELVWETQEKDGKRRSISRISRQALAGDPIRDVVGFYTDSPEFVAGYADRVTKKPQRGLWSGDGVQVPDVVYKTMPLPVIVEYKLQSDTALLFKSANDNGNTKLVMVTGVAQQ